MLDEYAVQPSEYRVKEDTLSHLQIADWVCCFVTLLLCEIELDLDFVDIYFLSHDHQPLGDCLKVPAKLLVQQEAGI